MLNRAIKGQITYQNHLDEVLVFDGPSMTFERAAGNLTIEMATGRASHQPPEIGLQSAPAWATATHSGCSAGCVPY